MIGKITREQEIIFIQWDGKDETLKLIEQYMLPKANLRKDGVTIKVQKIEDGDGEIFAISQYDRYGNSSFFHRVGDYIVLDYSAVSDYGIPILEEDIVYSIRGYSQEQFYRFYKDAPKSVEKSDGKKFKIKRRFPNYMTGFEETEHFVDTREELEKIDWIDNWKSEAARFYKFAISKSELGQHHHLMALLNYDDKFGGCKSWWVIGYIDGDNVDELGLEEYSNLIGNHLDGCPQKTWQHNDCECGFRK